MRRPAVLRHFWLAVEPRDPVTGMHVMNGVGKCVSVTTPLIIDAVRVEEVPVAVAWILTGKKYVQVDIWRAGSPPFPPGPVSPARAGAAPLLTVCPSTVMSIFSLLVPQAVPSSLRLAGSRVRPCR